MVAFYSSALDGVASNPALPTPLLLRLIAFDGGGHGPPFQALHRPMLPESAVAAVLTHPVLDTRVELGVALLRGSSELGERWLTVWAGWCPSTVAGEV
ncbi:hypothetical protein ACFVZI_30840, partial [Streptomyces mirabilis]